MSFEGQTIFIVGGSSGIGLAAACQLARQGARLALFARRGEVLVEAKSKVLAQRRAEPQTVKTYCLDAADYGATKRVFAEAISELGTPHVLINSAGGAHPRRFVDMEAGQLEQTLQANVATCWNPCKVIAPHMIAQSQGTIVNVASLAGLIGIYGYTDYALAKYGVVGFSEALRSELKPHGLKVQVFCPPDTQTPGFEEENKTKPRETAALSQGAKLMSAEGVAAALVKGLGSAKFIVLANLESHIFWRLQRFAPGLGRLYMDRIITKARK